MLLLDPYFYHLNVIIQWYVQRIRTLLVLEFVN